MTDQLSSNMRPGRVMLWVTPRTISTAFVKCMSGIPESEIWYEPYGHGNFAATYVKTACNIDLPMEYEGNEQLFEKTAEMFSHVLKANVSPERLPFATTKRNLEKSTSKYVFVKDESLAMDSDRARQFLPVGYKHSFLIRHPYLAFPSLRKAMYKQGLEAGLLHEDEIDESSCDLRRHEEIIQSGCIYQEHYALWKYIRENIDPNPIVIDSTDLLTKPAETLSKYCEAMGLPYSESLLKWDGSVESGMKWKFSADDLIYNTIFLGAAMTSTNFTPPKKPIPRDQLTDDIIELADKAMPFYQEMYDRRIGATS